MSSSFIAINHTRNMLMDSSMPP